jgi:MFS family permease
MDRDSGKLADKPDPGEERRNSLLLILNGGFMFMAMTFVSSDMVLPSFIQSLTSSTILIGLAGALMRIGWAWPQVFTSRLIESRQRKMPIVYLSGGFRSGTWFLIALLTFLVGNEHPTFFLVGFLVLYAVATSMMGISNVPWMDIIGKTISSTQRGKVFAVRRLVGGAMAMVSAGVISYVLGTESSLSFPYNYGTLFILSGAGTAISIIVFGLVREPIEPVRKTREPLGAYLVTGLGLLKKDANYRRLCIVQALWSFGMMATPFYVPYAISRFNIGLGYVGIFAGCLQISSVFSNVLWAYMGSRKGNQALMVYGSYFLGLSILVPILAEFVPDQMIVPFAFAGIETPFNLRIAFFASTFIFSGFATSGLFTGRMTYLLDIAPADRRPTYSSFLNMFSLPQGLLPILAGVLVAWTTYQQMFVVTLVSVPLTLWVVHRLEPVNKKN